MFVGDPAIKEIEYTVDRNTEWDGNPFSLDHYSCIVRNTGQKEMLYENPFVDTEPGDVFFYCFTVYLYNGLNFYSQKGNFL